MFWCRRRLNETPVQSPSVRQHRAGGTNLVMLHTTDERVTWYSPWKPGCRRSPVKRSHLPWRPHTWPCHTVVVAGEGMDETTRYSREFSFGWQADSERTDHVRLSRWRLRDIVWGWLFTISCRSRFSIDIAILPYRFEPYISVVQKQQLTFKLPGTTFYKDFWTHAQIKKKLKCSKIEWNYTGHIPVLYQPM